MTPAKQHSSVRQAKTLDVGIEITNGGAVVRMLARTTAGIFRHSARIAQPAMPATVIDSINSLIASARNQHRASSDAPLSIGGIGVAIWGQVAAADDATQEGVVVRMRHSHLWEHVLLGKMLSERWQCPVTVQAAASAAAIAESELLDETESAALLYLLPERDLPAVMVYNGTPDRAVASDPARFGHWPTGGKRICSCGARGHLQAVASAQAIVRNFIGLASTREADYDAMMRGSGGRAEAITAASVAALAAQGNPSASMVMGDAISALAPILTGLATWYDARSIAIGGILADSEDGFVAPLREAVAAGMGNSRAPVRVRGGRAGPAAVVYGALRLGEAAAGD